MRKEVLFVLLDEYADWEGAFLSTSLNFGVMPGSDKKYIPKTVAPTEKEVCSIGGFQTIPDYSFQNLPEDYAALILIGGMQWNTPAAESLAPIVTKALQQGKIVGAICNAASFMGRTRISEPCQTYGEYQRTTEIMGKRKLHKRERIYRKTVRI